MKSILIIDDDPMMQDLYQMKFSHLGYNILSATDGKSAIEQATNGKPDLITLDRRLGEEDGLEILKNLRQIESVKNVPVFMLSNMDATAELLAQIKTLGPAEYFIKEHIDLNDLAKKVTTLVGAA